MPRVVFGLEDGKLVVTPILNVMQCLFQPSTASATLT